MYSVTWDTDFKKPFFIFQYHMIFMDTCKLNHLCPQKFTAFSQPIFMNLQILNSIIYRSLILIFTKIIQQIWYDYKFIHIPEQKRVLTATIFMKFITLNITCRYTINFVQISHKIWTVQIGIHLSPSNNTTITELTFTKLMAVSQIFVRIHKPNFMK